MDNERVTSEVISFDPATWPPTSQFSIEMCQYWIARGSMSVSTTRDPSRHRTRNIPAKHQCSTEFMLTVRK